MTWCKVTWMGGLIEYYPNDCGEGQNTYNAYYVEKRYTWAIRRTKRVNYLPENATVIKMVKHNKGWKKHDK